MIHVFVQPSLPFRYHFLILMSYDLFQFSYILNSCETCNSWLFFIAVVPLRLFLFAVSLGNQTWDITIIFWGFTVQYLITLRNQIF